jgi:spoIIIJ-associated protein
MNPSSENTIEATGDSIEQAIASGLKTLGAQPFEVIVEVLEDPTPAMFGMEARPAKVRLQRISYPKPPMPEPPPKPLTRSPEPAARPQEERPPRPERREVSSRQNSSERRGRGDRRERGESQSRSGGHSEGQGRGDRPERRGRGDRSERPDRHDRPPRAEESDAAFFDVDEDPGLPFNPQEGEVPEAEYDDEVAIGKVVLNELLERLDVRARIVVRRSQADEQDEKAPWILDVYGSYANRLIGRRGDTLAALQYITRLITSRELQRRSDVIVDVESYKSRRARQLHALALRMAEDAVTTQRVITLEPMPPHERRIVHLALRGRADIETRSIGEGDARKVTIVPKEQA